MSNYARSGANGENKGMADLKEAFLHLYYLTSTPTINQFTQEQEVLFVYQANNSIACQTITLKIN